MAEISISNKDWPRIKIKLQRKYNHLTNEQLQYTEGQEETLISRLEALINRNRDYVVFTLKKALVNIDNNRLEVSQYIDKTEMLFVTLSSR